MRSWGGRPKIEAKLRALIRRLNRENPIWGAPRIHGELLKLGFEVAQSTVAKYMVKRRGPPSQGWHLPAQPCAGDRRHGHVRRTDHWLQASLWHRHHAFGPAPPGVD